MASIDGGRKRFDDTMNSEQGASSNNKGEPQKNDSVLSNQEIGHILPTGYQLFEYQIESVLGIGGFGVTYLAEDTNLHTQIALKEYLPSNISVRSQDSSVHPNSESNEGLYRWGLDSFLQESRTLASFKHPNIVRVLRFFEMNNTAYMVMEYEKGMSLKEYVDIEGPPNETEMVDMFLPLLEGLAGVHDKKFLHRDIKPGNIIVRQDKTMVLLDFGAARQSADEQSDANGLTTIVSPGYAPLEQYDRHGNQGPWSDIYALGGVMYWLISGKVPQVAPTRMREDPMIPAQEIGKGRFSKKLLKAIDWALSVREEDRPQSLEQYMSAITGREVELSTTDGQVRIKTTARSPSKVKTAVLTVLGTLLLLLATVGGYLYWQQAYKPSLGQNIPDIDIKEGELTWQKTFGGANDDQMVSMEALPGGGLIGVGWTKSEGAGGTDIFAIKLDRVGRVIWKSTYGGAGNESPEDIKILSDGTGALVLAKTSSKGNGGIDVWVFKIDSEGEVVWENTFGGAYDDVPGDIQAMDNGNYLIAAYTQSKGAGSEDIWFYEANNEGEIIWEKTFGGAMSDIPDDLKVLKDGGYLMTGWQDSKGAGGFDAWMIKLDSQGEKIWGRTYGGAGDDIIETMHVVSDGVLLAGRTDSKGLGGTDAWLMKVDKEGKIIWEKTYGWGKYDDFRDIENASDGTFIIAGITKSVGKGSGDIWVLNITNDGEVLWVKTFGGKGHEEISDFEPTFEKDGGLIFAGSTRSQGAGGWDSWVFRTETEESTESDDY